MIHIVGPVEKVPVFKNKFRRRAQRVANVQEKFQNISTG
jgi:hypothetical protein